ncbi:MAG: 1-acyl-sn-glycerol-3-phosphate acyltransferase [Oscillospiraceae bacterium]|nr:1-acyl-sn-glycerol-3-phosphate acyltransferase [Oscillospiraceae bacterium]
MLIGSFVLLALAAAALYAWTAGFVFWKVLLVFALSYLAVNVLFILLWGLVSLFIDTAKPREKQFPLSRLGCNQISEFVCAYARLRVHVTGEEKLPQQGRFLMVCNHRSMFDPLIVLDKLRKYDISFVSKPSNMRIPIAGRIAYGAGFLSINRENDREALRTILTAADYLKRDLCSMAIYPEGTRSKTGRMLPFHAGSFKIAQKANVPLVIASVRGTDEAKKNLPFKRTDVYLDILEVLPAERVKAESTQELARYSRELMERKLEETT